MSKDLRLKHTCPHLVSCEALALDADRRTLRTVQPPSSNAVLVYINGQFVPRTGVFSRIEVTSLIPQPYLIEASDNDVVSISVNDGPTQTVTLPTGVAVSAEDIATVLDDNLTGVTVHAEKGRIVFLHEQAGPNTTLAMKGGSAHATLGLKELRVYRGRQVLPGWTLIRDPRSPVPTDRVIYFNEALKAQDDIIEVTYTTQRSLCRRCNGLGLENDFRYDQVGEPLFVENQILLLQEVEKIVFTIKGSNVFHTWYGTSLFNLIGSKIGAGGQILEAQLITEIQTALENYQNIKDRQALSQEVTALEQLRRIVSIEVRQDPRDLTVFRVSVALENRAGRIEQFEDTLIVVNQRVN